VSKLYPFNFLHSSFYISLLTGLIIWLITWAILPVNTGLLSLETICFIGFSFGSIILGYRVIQIKNVEKIVWLPHNFFFKVLIVILCIGLLFRYIDLFYFRNLSLSNLYYQNKILSLNNSQYTPLIVTFLGALRALYYVPILYLIIIKSKNKSLWIISITILLLFGVEIILFGTRKPLFHLLILILITLGLTVKNYKQLLNKYTVGLLIFITIGLGFFSYFILNKRVTEVPVKNINLIDVVNSRYNDFVPIKNSKLNDFKKSPNSLTTKTEVMLIHTGQYIVHGFYELDYIINNNLPKAHGKYSFNPIFKALERLDLGNDYSNTLKYHPRDYVYVSFFGSFFIDFGWFSLILFFIYGMFQKMIVSFAKNNPFIMVLWVITLCINLIMPIFNLVSGVEFYLQVFLILIVLSQIKYRTLNT
tara:strand:- start:1640 stop:2896 length:1257 start_codon:yes stop_codon:yes gene_type:complete